jgi:hypothetical protein
MAQAAADPFDSLDNMAESLADTDDLLSQMAGKEVDRLLAENGSDAPEPAPPAPVVAPPADQSMSSQLDELFTELQTPGSPANPPAAAADSKTEPLTAGAERAALLEAAGFATSAPAGATAPAAPPEGDSQDPITDAAPQGEERSAMLKAAGFEAGDEAAAPSPTDLLEPEPAAIAPLPPLPGYLRPLSWISTPLDACPSVVRRIVGVAAIVTLVNALAVLTYVLMIRRH